MRVFYYLFAPISTALTVLMILMMMGDPIIPASPAHPTSIATAFIMAGYMICATLAAWRARGSEDHE